MPDLGQFSMDPDAAVTLPGHLYYNPKTYELEQEAIFARTWQYVAHVSRLQSPGDYVVKDIGQQSVFVVRTADGELKGFHNVCQHRAHPLLNGQGQLSGRITCPYHAWAYGLDGVLQFARGSENVAGFKCSEIRLQPVRIDTLCGFVFVNMDNDALSIAELHAGLEKEIRPCHPTLKYCSKPTRIRTTWQRTGRTR